ncbi:hypothetical protein PAESOLCIP111_00947 [Paenibacillus solanacearum]|uniref:Histidine phosphatase family protein n=1 Tax=Paenibacillus solanacearum TaxID=2048548 RepID=A0A916JWI4_9BACL|nr:hypothetical protein PAESOLCIP111_00947 [Paenibacillus solanacearum]
MITTLYWVRHADSPYIPGMERTRGLSSKGTADAAQVAKRLRDERIDAIISSPYERAIATVKGLADALHLEIAVEEDLRERQVAGETHRLAIDQFLSAKRAVYEDWNYSFPGGESSRQAQSRAVRVLTRLLEQHAGESIVIGTHGDIMTLMMNHFDPRYNYAFWQSTTMPDIYRLRIERQKLTDVTRLWGY